MNVLDPFHKHLDACARCREQPFNLCPAGEDAIKASIRLMGDELEKGGVPRSARDARPVSAVVGRQDCAVSGVPPMTVENPQGHEVALVGDAVWAECLCAEIDPADVPCIVCESREAQGLPPCEAMVFEYGGRWWEFTGYVEDRPGETWDEQRYGRCLYGVPLDGTHNRPDLPGLIFNRREIRPLTPAMENV